MAGKTRATVILADETTGTADIIALNQGEASVEVVLTDGRIIEAPSAAFELQGNGAYLLPVSLGSEETVSSESIQPLSRRDGEAHKGDGDVIPVVVEEAEITKRVVETGRVRIRKTVSERQEVADQPLFREEIEVRRVPVNQPVTGAVEIRHEGETMIIPLVEEVLVVVKRRVIREELHVIRRRIEEHRPEKVTLRSENAEVERIPVERNSVIP